MCSSCLIPQNVRSRMRHLLFFSLFFFQVLQHFHRLGVGGLGSMPESSLGHYVLHVAKVG